MEFEFACDLTDVETIAVGLGIRDLQRLRRLDGPTTGLDNMSRG